MSELDLVNGKPGLSGVTFHGGSLWGKTGEICESTRQFKIPYPAPLKRHVQIVLSMSDVHLRRQGIVAMNGEHGRYVWHKIQEDCNRETAVIRRQLEVA